MSLSYAKPEDNSYVSISGTAELITDQKKAQELWDPSYEQWFPQGASDPSLILIRVTVEQAEYWHAPSSALHPAGGVRRAGPGAAGQPGVPREDRNAERVRPGHHHKRPVFLVRDVPCDSSITGHSLICADQGETPQERAEDLIRRLTNEKDIPRRHLCIGESVERAIAEVRTVLEKTS